MGGYHYPTSYCGRWATIFTKLFLWIIFISFLDFLFSNLGVIITWGVSIAFYKYDNSSYYSVWDGMDHTTYYNTSSYMCYFNYKSWRFWMICGPIGLKVFLIIYMFFAINYYILYQCCCAKSIRNIYKENAGNNIDVKDYDEEDDRNERFAKPQNSFSGDDTSTEYLVFEKDTNKSSFSGIPEKDDSNKGSFTSPISILKKKNDTDKTLAGTF
jgi:hypothetical protein